MMTEATSAPRAHPAAATNSPGGSATSRRPLPWVTPFCPAAAIRDPHTGAEGMKGVRDFHRQAGTTPHNTQAAGPGGDKRDGVTPP